MHLIPLAIALIPSLHLVRFAASFTILKFFSTCTGFGGRVVRAFAFEAVDSGLIQSRVKPMTSKLVFAASLLEVQH